MATLIMHVNSALMATLIMHVNSAINGNPDYAC